MGHGEWKQIEWAPQSEGEDFLIASDRRLIEFPFQSFQSNRHPVHQAERESDYNKVLIGFGEERQRKPRFRSPKKFP